jgi:hypothetical protein
MPNKVNSGTIITPGASDIVIPQGYFGGATADGKVKGDANLLAANILSGKSIFGVGGSIVPITGKRSATGSATTSSDIITVTGLTFTPSIVIIANLTRTTIINYFSIYVSQNAFSIAAPSNISAMMQNGTLNSAASSINNGMFAISVPRGATTDTAIWIAIE